MKIKTTQDLSNCNDLESLRRFTSITFKDIIDGVNGNLSFADNVLSSIISATFTAANTTTSFNHTLNQSPSGYLVIGRNSAITVYDGATANTNKKIYLQSSGAGVAKILIF